MDGWIKIYRGIVENPLWNIKPFSKGQAWIDLILQANYTESKTLIGNKLESVEKGSFITSELKLMNCWGWSKNKVRAFLQYLENENMIIKISNKKRTIIKIVNYSLYQDMEVSEQMTKLTIVKESDKDLEKPVITKKETQVKKRVKDKNEDNIQMLNRLLPDYPISDVLSDKVREWIGYKISKKEAYVERGMKSLLKIISQSSHTYGDFAVMDLIDMCMSNNWKGIIWDKLNTKQSGNKDIVNEWRNS